MTTVEHDWCRLRHAQVGWDFRFKVVHMLARVMRRIEGGETSGAVGGSRDDDCLTGS